MSKLTEYEKKALEAFEKNGETDMEKIKKYPLIWAYVYGKNKGVESFDELIEQHTQNKDEDKKN